jgi:hypothetical protein
MAWWVKVAGTGEAAYTQERWNERCARLRSQGSGPSLFPKRPRIARGDRLVVYASGSAALYGEGRFVAVEEVVSDEPEPSGHERWRWRLDTRLVAAVDELAMAPGLRDIGVSAKSLRQHSHIRLSDEQGNAALELVRRFGAVHEPTGDGPRDEQAELEALKRKPASR